MIKNNSKVKMISCLLLIIMLIGTTGCSTSTSTEGTEEETFVLKVGHDQSTEHYYHLGLEKFKEGVEERTNGRVTVEIYPLSQLGSQRSVVEGVATGTVEMYLTNTMTLSAWLPKMGVFDLPFIFENREQAYEILDGEITGELNKEIEKEGLKVLAYFENGYRHITSSVALHKPEDIAGLKIRVPESPVYIDTFTELGAAPTPMAFNELFTALQTGIVDAQENPAGHAVVNRFYEVCDYINLTGHIYTPEPLVIGMHIWNVLPDDLKTIIQEEAYVARDYERQLSSESETSYLEELESVGMEIIESDVAAFREKCGPVYDKYEDLHGETLRKINEALSK